MPIPILYLINTLSAGGSERQLLYLLAGLNRDRFAPVVCTIFDDATYPPHPAYVAQLDTLNIPRHTLVHGSGWRGRTAVLRRLIALEWRLRPAIVQGFLHYANLLTRAVRPFAPPHILYTSARDTYLSGEIRSESYTWWLDNMLVCNAPQVQAQVLENTRRPPHRVRVIPNGVPLADFAHNPIPDMRMQIAHQRQFVLIYVGRIAEKKNLLTLVRAVALLPPDLRDQLQVFLLGAVSSSTTLHELEQAITQHGLIDVFRRFEAVEDVRPYYHAADALVLPSYIEGMPNVVLEAFAAGKPAIVSDGANEAKLVQHGVNGWTFETTNAQALAATIADVMQLTPETRAVFARQAQLSVADYSIEAMVRRYNELYEAVL